jgi:hypothetical protein
MTENEEWSFTREHLLFALVFLLGVAGTGLVRRYLQEAGLGRFGWLVFVVGYGGMVLVLWYVWLRPLDLTGPAGR